MLPNEKGQYWDPFVLINSFYSINNQYIEINKFLRKNFLKIKSYDFYMINENIQKVEKYKLFNFFLILKLKN